jgi:hypothetical protein
MRRIVLLFGLTTAAISCTSKPPLLDGLGVRLTGPVELSLEQNSATWTASIVNHGAAAIDIVQPGDGSECGMRTPLVGWSIIPAAGPLQHPQEVPLSSGARCGNINAIKSSDVVSLPPGGELLLSPWIGQPVFPGTGTYRVVLYFENKPDMPVSGIPLGEHDGSALRRIRRTASFALRSNEITVVVRG